MSLPLPLRNRLAELIVGAFTEPAARAGLAAVAAVARERAPARRVREWAGAAALLEAGRDGVRLRAAWRPHARALGDRAHRALAAVPARPASPAGRSLRATLGDAAALFDAGLYFETHELLEARWRRARGPGRDALQALIQVAVGFQHLANGNVAGCASLLRAGARLHGRRLAGLSLTAFAAGVLRCRDEVLRLGPSAARRFRWSRVPRFPGGKRPMPPPGGGQGPPAGGRECGST